jgi:catechol 2,3-dioxygenase-like lactoylglutathione lyase family enzyme
MGEEPLARRAISAFRLYLCLTMKYTLSRCICIETPDSEAAATFYQDVFGMEFSMRDGNSIELKSGQALLYFDKAPSHTTISSLLLTILMPHAPTSNRKAALSFDGKAKGNLATYVIRLEMCLIYTNPNRP